MIINNFFNKIKSKYSIDNITIIYLFVVIGVGVSSFLLGRFSVIKAPNVKNNISIINKKEESALFVNNSFEQKNITTNYKQVKEKRYLASKNGKLYYPILCNGAKRIIEKNRVWFESKLEAEKLGYILSPNCK